MSPIFIDIATLLGLPVAILLLVLLLMRLPRPLPKLSAGEKKWWSALAAHFHDLRR